jgi:hypothetical protein
MACRPTARKRFLAAGWLCATKPRILFIAMVAKPE